MMRIRGYGCPRCGRHFPATVAAVPDGCPNCAPEAPVNLVVRYFSETEFSARSASSPGDETPSLWRYADFLPCSAREAISLGEGLTPLLPARTLGAVLGVPNLLIKDESKNPTWSHKDRFSTVAVSMARMQGVRVVATASSGNAGASLAAYAARAGLQCVVVTFAGTAGAMLAQAEKYGATVVPLSDKSQRWPLLAICAKEFGWFVTSPYRAPVIGSHPFGIEGYKTLAYELVEQMRGTVPDWCVLPVCYGDALAGIWQGFEDLRTRGVIDRLPRLVAAEVHGSLANALAVGGDLIAEMPATFETLAVSIGTTRSTYQAVRALRASGGTAVPVSNQGLIELQDQVARAEGILAELASVTPFAAIAKLRQQQVIQREDTVVAVVTGSGLKDMDRSVHDAAAPTAFHSNDEALAFLRGNMDCDPTQPIAS